MSEWWKKHRNPFLSPLGRAAPIVPICTSCKVPCQRFAILPQSDHLRVRMSVQCHGKTVEHSDDADKCIRRGYTLVSFGRATFNSTRMRDPLRL